MIQETVAYVQVLTWWNSLLTRRSDSNDNYENSESDNNSYSNVALPPTNFHLQPTKLPAWVNMIATIAETRGRP